MVTFNLGLAGRFSGESTPNGLVFISYDKRGFLYPTSLYSTYLAQGGAAQSALSEIGKPMRNVFAQINSSRLDEVVTVHYHYGIRDWWVVSFPTSASQDLPQTWVYDFLGKVWFQLQRGFSSLNVFEVSEGDLVLIGGGVDGNSYVIDDQTGTYSTDTALPVATWQPALVNFGDDEHAHVVVALSWNLILRHERIRRNEVHAVPVDVLLWPSRRQRCCLNVASFTKLIPVAGYNFSGGGVIALQSEFPSAVYQQRPTVTCAGNGNADCSTFTPIGQRLRHRLHSTHSFALNRR